MAVIGLDDAMEKLSRSRRVSDHREHKGKVSVAALLASHYPGDMMITCHPPKSEMFSRLKEASEQGKVIYLALEIQDDLM